MGGWSWRQLQETPEHVVRDIRTWMRKAGAVEAERAAIDEAHRAARSGRRNR